MAVTLGQVSLVAALAALASKKGGAAVAAVLASGLVNITTESKDIKIPAESANGLKKFEPKVPNKNKAERRKEKCIDLQLKLKLKAINFKLPSLNLSLVLPKLPTINLEFLNFELSKEIQCVLEALALIAMAKALLAQLESESAGGGAAGTAGGTTAAGTTTTTATTTAGKTVKTTTYYNPSLLKRQAT